LRVVLLGPPGAGKGTQGTRLAECFAVPHIASGDILRRIMATEDSDLARAVRVINEGRMIPDAVANAVVFRELARPEAAQGFILDGYPRDVVQAEALERYLADKGQILDAVLALMIEEQALLARLVGRLTCPNCGESYHAVVAPPKVSGICDRCGHALGVRRDDEPDRIRTRFAVYREKTEPLMAFYRERGLLKAVDASGSEETVFAAVLQAVGAGGSQQETLV